MKNKVFVARPDSWYKEGTICELICEITEDSGLFSGIKVVKDDDHDYINMGREIGHEFLDEESCTYDEFDIYELEEASLYKAGDLYRERPR
jgi:hypothetical protein